MQKDKLIIFDTTMRDGEQSPGASMTREEKLRIGRQLERMHVDVIEAGFPAASDGDFESVKAVAAAIKDSTVCGLARANERDVRRCGEAVRGATSPRIHTFIATSPIHMEKKLRMEPKYFPPWAAICRVSLLGRLPRQVSGCCVRKMFPRRTLSKSTTGFVQLNLPTVWVLM